MLPLLSQIVTITGWGVLLSGDYQIVFRQRCPSLSYTLNQHKSGLQFARSVSCIAAAGNNTVPKILADSGILHHAGPQEPPSNLEGNLGIDGSILKGLFRCCGAS